MIGKTSSEVYSKVRNILTNFIKGKHRPIDQKIRKKQNDQVLYRMKGIGIHGKFFHDSIPESFSGNQFMILAGITL